MSSQTAVDVAPGSDLGAKTSVFTPAPAVLGPLLEDLAESRVQVNLERLVSEAHMLGSETDSLGAQRDKGRLLAFLPEDGTRPPHRNVKVTYTWNGSELVSDYPLEVFNSYYDLLGPAAGNRFVVDCEADPFLALADLSGDQALAEVCRQVRMSSTKAYSRGSLYGDELEKHLPKGASVFVYHGVTNYLFKGTGGNQFADDIAHSFPQAAAYALEDRTSKRFAVADLVRKRTVTNLARLHQELDPSDTVLIALLEGRKLLFDAFDTEAEDRVTAAALGLLQSRTRKLG